MDVGCQRKLSGKPGHEREVFAAEWLGHLQGESTGKTLCPQPKGPLPAGAEPIGSKVLTRAILRLVDRRSTRRP
jgi:hypothetical protein